MTYCYTYDHPNRPEQTLKFDKPEDALNMALKLIDDGYGSYSISNEPINYTEEEYTYVNLNAVKN